MSSTVEKKRKIGVDEADVFVYTGIGQSVPRDVVSVRFHPSVTEIEEGAFYSCRSLGKVVLNDGLTKIGKRAFSECRSLESITFPSTIVEIGSSAFFSTALRSIKLPPNRN